MADRQLESWGGHGGFFHMTGDKGQLFEDVQTEKSRQAILMLTAIFTKALILITMDLIPVRTEASHRGMPSRSQAKPWSLQLLTRFGLTAREAEWALVNLKMRTNCGVGI